MRKCPSSVKDRVLAYAKSHPKLGMNEMEDYGAKQIARWMEDQTEETGSGGSSTSTNVTINIVPHGNGKTEPEKPLLALPSPAPPQEVSASGVKTAGAGEMTNAVMTLTEFVEKRLSSGAPVESGAATGTTERRDYEGGRANIPKFTYDRYQSRIRQWIL